MDKYIFDESNGLQNVLVERMAHRQSVAEQLKTSDQMARACPYCRRLVK